jgi:uncharacterized protein (TIGR02246 family)
MVGAAAEVEALYRALLDRWNERDAVGYAELFAEGGSIVGFDGSCVESPASITEHLRSIFADHDPASYVAQVHEIRSLAAGVLLVRSVVGMVPPGGSDIDPDLNAVQGLVAVHTDRGWRVGHLQNTPAAFHGRPEEAEMLTAELRGSLSSSE